MDMKKISIMSGEDLDPRLRDACAALHYDMDHIAAKNFLSMKKDGMDSADFTSALVYAFAQCVKQCSADAHDAILTSLYAYLKYGDEPPVELLGQ